MKKKILFVDDDPAILQGIRNILRSERKQWDIQMATCGEEALEVLGQDTYDVIVSDLRMPTMDGVTLLRAVKGHFPEVIRIVLSGNAELAATTRATLVAHQMLAKPCEPTVLKSALQWACNLKTSLANNVFRRMIGGVENLPAPPTLYLELSNAIDDPQKSLADIAKIVRTDAGTTAKLLQIVNSPFFGVAKQVTGIDTAVVYLGTNLIKHLVLTMIGFQNLAKEGLSGGIRLQHLQRHVMLTAQIAGKIAKQYKAPKQVQEDAFTMALLHDIGLLVLSARLPGEFGALIDQAQRLKKPLYQLEKQWLGVTHGDVGAYLLGLWGLPYPIIEAAACHHDISEVRPDALDVIRLLQLANGLAEKCVPLLPSLSEVESFPYETELVLFGEKQKFSTLERIADEEAKAICVL
jgi:HD-like signal output (HDOD) protein